MRGRTVLAFRQSDGGEAGLPNTGGGGTGGTEAGIGSAGGSGIIIVRYLIQ